MTRSPTSRDEGIDIARALLVLSMVLWHAVDAWSSPEARTSPWFSVIALIGSTALPGFLLLAGVGVGLGVEAAARRGKPWTEVRRALVRRGLVLVAAGYAFNLAQALVDGAPSLQSVLRADVLHGIGLSMVLVVLVHVRPVREGASPVVALAMGALAVAPFVGLASMDVTGPLAPLAALFAYVPGLSRAPLVPVVAMMAAGVALARLASGIQKSWPALVAVGVACVASSALARAACDTTLSTLGGKLTPAHPAVVFNALDGSVRAFLTVALGGLLARVPWAPFRTAFVRVGRASLFAYVIHIPFCYGRLGAPLARSLPLLLAIAAALVLFALVTCAVAVEQTFRDRRRRVEPAAER